MPARVARPGLAAGMLRGLRARTREVSRVAGWLGTGSRALSYFLGGAILVLAATVFWTAEPPAGILDWALGVFGWTFLLLLGALAFVCLLACVHLGEDAGGGDAWRVTGLHAANGIATLALTYTLLGISLGIGSLAEQELTPTTIHEVIRDLTRHFSMAFLTSVVGLPIAAAFRALIVITCARRPRAGHHR